MASKQPKTLTDLAITKSVYMNGRKFGGVHRIQVDYDISSPNTKVHLTLTIKKDSLKIEDNKISFDSFLQEA